LLVRLDLFSLDFCLVRVIKELDRDPELFLGMTTGASVAVAP
jgi:hypothetical protein